MLEITLSEFQLPEKHEDMRPNAVTEILSKEYMKRLWNIKSEKITDDSLLYDGWYKRLRHHNKADTRSLAQKGIILRRLATIKRIPFLRSLNFF